MRIEVRQGDLSFHGIFPCIPWVHFPDDECKSLLALTSFVQKAQELAECDVSGESCARGGTIEQLDDTYFGNRRELLVVIMMRCFFERVACCSHNRCGDHGDGVTERRKHNF